MMRRMAMEGRDEDHTRVEGDARRQLSNRRYLKNVEVGDQET